MLNFRTTKKFLNIQSPKTSFRNVPNLNSSNIKFSIFNSFSSPKYSFSSLKPTSSLTPFSNHSLVFQNSKFFQFTSIYSKDSFFLIRRNSSNSSLVPLSYSNKTLRTKLWSFAKQHKWKIAGSLFFGALTAFSEVSVVQIIRPLMDSVLEHRSQEELVVTSLLFLLMFSGRTIFRFLQNYLIRLGAVQIVFDLRAALHNHVTSLDLPFFAINKPGNLTSRMTNDLGIIQNGIGQIGALGFGSLFSVIGLILATLYMNLNLFAFALLIFPVSLGLVRLLGKRIRKNVESSQSRLAQISDNLNESFLSMPLIISYKLQDIVKQRFNKFHNQYLFHQLNVWKYETLTSPAAELSGVIAISAIVYFGGAQVLTGDMTAGQLVSFLGSLTLLQRHFRTLMESYSVYQEILGATSRLMYVLSAKRTIIFPEKPVQTAPLSLPIQISASNVSFRYPSSSEEQAIVEMNLKMWDEFLVLKNVSFQLPPGKMIALIGESGSGKSTLLSLFNRLFDPTQGTIFLNDIDLKSFSAEELSKLITIAHQTPYLLNDTIEENIRLGNPTASNQDITNALRLAGAITFIKELPKGLQTVIGEDWIPSYGQKQRLSLARAFLSPNPILLIDEPTEGLDLANETTISNSLETLKSTRTIIYSTHKRNLANKADIILELRRGNLVSFVEKSKK